MDVSEIPMILFTTIAQMCVGAFIVLGAVQLFAGAKYSRATVDRLTDPVLLAIGPAMILGLGVSMLHMHDVTHTLNVLRHWNSSWLSREIIFGSAFAGLGFLFFLLQWRKWGSPLLRQLLAGLTALVGVALLGSMSMIYYSLTTVPAWHSWFTPVQFFTTALLLGALLVGLGLVVFAKWHPTLPGHAETPEAKRADGATAADAADGSKLVATAITWIAITAVVAAGIIFIATPLFISGLVAMGGTAAKSAAVYGHGMAIWRFLLLGLAAACMAVFGLSLAGRKGTLTRLTVVLAAAFLLALVGELVGRGLFYEAMLRVGI